MFRSLPSFHSPRSWLAAVLVTAAALGATAAGAQERPAKPAATRSATAAAQQTPAALYHNYCSVCHGDNGDGKSRAQGSMKPPPRDFTTPQAAQELTRDRMIAAIKGGVPGTAMVGWKSQLSDAQIVQVADFVRSKFMAPSINDDKDRGRKLYARVCSVCHGDRGNGSMWASANLRPAPRDFSSHEAKSLLTRERMINAVAVGRPGTAMSGYASRLPPADIELVVDYVRTSIMGLESKPASATGYPDGLKGNVVAGKKMYDDNCATCHGVKGDGKGPRAYFIMPKPRVLTSDETRATFGRSSLYAGVANGRRGTEMPAWDKVLTPQQIADVSEYVYRSFIDPRSTDVAKKK